MLEKIREGSQGPWAVAIVGLIVLSFIFTGVGSYLGGSTSNAVATVNGEEITEQTLEQAYQNERARMEGQFGEAISAMFANEETLAEFKRNILDRLINERLIQQKAFELGLRVGDQEIKQAIVDMPEFQLLGQFDNDTYLARLRQAGYQPTDFRDIMRNQMTSQQLNAAVTGSAFSLENEVSRMLTLQQQTRDASIVEIKTSDFTDAVTLTEEEIQAYYDSNVERFETQEQISLAYVNLEVTDLADMHSVTDEEAQTYYSQNMARYQTEEERRVSHILFELSDDDSATEAQATAVLTQLQNGADFAELVSVNSADIVSAESGGDLGYISLGMMDQAFEDAAFALSEVGQITDLVKTEFGFHIIKVTDIKPSVVTPIADVIDEIKDNLLKEKATETFFEYQEQMAALAFEVPDTLDEVANVFEGTVFETALFERGRLPAAVNYPQIEGIAFSSELVDERVNSDLLEINNDKIMFIRVAEHKPERTLSLDEVKEGIVAQLTQDKAQQLALAAAQAIQVALLNAEDTSDLVSAQNTSWSESKALTRSGSSLDPKVAAALFELTTDAQNNTAVVTQSNANVAVVKLDAVNSVQDIDSAEIDNAKGTFAVNRSRRSYENFIEALRAESDIILTQE